MFSHYCLLITITVAHREKEGMRRNREEQTTESPLNVGFFLLYLCFIHVLFLCFYFSGHKNLTGHIWENKPQQPPTSRQYNFISGYINYLLKTLWRSILWYWEIHKAATPKVKISWFKTLHIHKYGTVDQIKMTKSCNFQKQTLCCAEFINLDDSRENHIPTQHKGKHHKAPHTALPFSRHTIISHLPKPGASVVFSASGNT